MIMTVEIAGEGSTILIPTSVTQTHDQVFKYGFSNLVDSDKRNCPSIVSWGCDELTKGSTSNFLYTFAISSL